nr:DUF2147 domain-containing protein [Acinetobacter amyesii]
MVGLEIIKEFKSDPQRPNQYRNGTILDPL